MGKRIESEIGVRVKDADIHIVYLASILDGWQLFTGQPVEIFNKINGDVIPFSVIAKSTNHLTKNESKYFQLLFISDTCGKIFFASTTKARHKLEDKVQEFAYSAALEVLIQYEYDFERIRAAEDRSLIAYEKKHGLKPGL